MHCKAVWPRNVMVDTALIFIIQNDDFRIYLSIDRVLFYGICFIEEKKKRSFILVIRRLKKYITSKIACACK